MNNDSISTEGRIFARQIAREAARREAVGAAALRPGTTSWQDAMVGLSRIFTRPAPHVVRHTLANITHRLNAISTADQGYEITKFGRSRNLHTLHADNHTLNVMTGIESGIIIQQHRLFTERYSDMLFGLVIANVSDHAFGRFYDRSPTPPSVADGLAFAFICGMTGNAFASDMRLLHSEVNIAVPPGLIATGSMKMASDASGKLASAFFDCRTVLPPDAVDDEQLRQVAAVAEVASGAKTSVIPYIERRSDFVLDTLAASRRPKQ